MNHYVFVTVRIPLEKHRSIDFAKKEKVVEKMSNILSAEFPKAKIISVVNTTSTLVNETLSEFFQNVEKIRKHPPLFEILYHRSKSLRNRIERKQLERLE